MFGAEPLRAGSPLADCPKLILTPHVAGVTAESNVRVSSLIATKSPLGVIDEHSLEEARNAHHRPCRTDRGSRHARTAQCGRLRGDGTHNRNGAREALQSLGPPVHGMSRIPQYATHLRNGRAEGGTVAPAIVRSKGGALLVDARSGLAFPACALAVQPKRSHVRANSALRWQGLPTAIALGLRPIISRPVAAAGMVGLSVE